MFGLSDVFVLDFGTSGDALVTLTPDNECPSSLETLIPSDASPRGVIDSETSSHNAESSLHLGELFYLAHDEHNPFIPIHPLEEDKHETLDEISTVLARPLSDLGLLTCQPYTPRGPLVSLPL